MLAYYEDEDQRTYSEDEEFERWNTEQQRKFEEQFDEDEDPATRYDQNDIPDGDAWRGLNVYPGPFGGSIW